MGKFNLLTTLSLNASGLSEGLKKSVKEVENYVNSTEAQNSKLSYSFRDLTEMGVGEMRKELMKLRNVSFAGKSQEEIAIINNRIGELTDTMGDLKAQQKALGSEFGSVLAGGLQTAAAVGEIAVGAASMFGVSKEQAEKYQKAMVTLIGVSQAFGTIQDAIETRQLQVIGLKIKALYSQTAATVQATIAQTGLNAAMSASVIGAAIVAVAALAAGITYLVTEQNKAADAAEKHYKEIKRLNDFSFEAKKRIEETAESSFKSYIKQQLYVEKLVKAILDENTSLKERNEYIRIINSLDPSYISNQDKKTLATEQGKAAVARYLIALKQKAEAEASEVALSEVYLQKFRKQQEIKNLERGKEVYLIQKAALEKAIAEDIELEHYYENYRALQAKNKQIEEQDSLIEHLGVESGNYDLTISNLTKTIDKNSSSVEFNTGASGKSTTGKDKETTSVGKLDNAISELNAQILEYIALGKDVRPLVIDLNAKQSKKDEIVKTKDALIKGALELTIPDPEANEKQILSLAQEVINNLENDLKPIELKLAPIPVDSFNGVMEQVGNLAGALSGFFNQESSEYKAFATAQALISTYLAAVQVMANQAKLGPIAMGLAFAGTIATGLAAVAKIQGFADGGIVPGYSFSGDNTLARVNSKEMILTQSQQAHLFDIANGSGSTYESSEVTFRIEADTLVGVLDKYNRKQRSIRGR